MHIKVKKGETTVFERFFTEGDLLEAAVKEKVLAYVVLEEIASADEVEVVRVN